MAALAISSAIAAPARVSDPRWGNPMRLSSAARSSRRPGTAVSILRASAAAATPRVRANAGQISVQEFLDEATELGEVHLYINTHTGQWRTRTTMGMFRYSDAEEYAWDACIVHDDGDTEANMYVNRVASASFKQDKVLGLPYYIIQFVSPRGVAFTLTLKADTKTQEYDPNQVETYNALLKKFGSEVRFSNKIHPT